MTHRIALATTDRLTIYQHFGRTSAFHIVDVGDETYDFVEVRKTPRACGNPGGGHNEDVFDEVLALLSDCEGIVVGKIGPGAAEYLLRREMRVFEAPGTVDKIMESIIVQKLL